MTKLTKKAENELRIATNKRTAWDKKLGTLTGHIFTRRDHAAATVAYEAGTTAEAYAAVLASAEPVGAALHQQKESAVQHADKEAREFVAKLLAQLAEKGNNLDIIAPYPDSFRESTESYRRKQARRNLFNRITRDVNPNSMRSFNDKSPRIVEADLEAIERFVISARQDAAMEYDMFICKMVAKVGEAVAARIEGNHVWSYSHLTVALPNGTEQVWKTQQIVNYSKYGTPYAQWPSRKV